MSAASIAPLLKPAGSTLLGSFRIDSSPGKVVFAMRGAPRWTVDTTRFDGRPKVGLDRSGKQIVVRLDGAIFPGTDLSADFVAVLTPGLSGWRMHYSSALGFEGDVPFEAWLMRSRALVAGTELSAVVGPSLLNPVLRLGGRSRVSVSPDWTLWFSGPAIAKADAPGVGIVSDHVTLHLLEPDHPSLFAAPLKRRTLFTLERLEREWDIHPRLHSEDVWQLKAVPNAFDRLLVEAGAPGRMQKISKRSYAVCAECTDSRRHVVSVVPAPCCTTFEGSEFEIPLADARYAVTINGAGRHAAIASGFINGTSWLRTDDFSLRVGKTDDDGSTFCISASDGRIESVDCGLELHETLLQTDDDDVIARPVRFPEARPLRILAGKKGGMETKRASKAGFAGVAGATGIAEVAGAAGVAGSARVAEEDRLELVRRRGGVRAQVRLAVAPVELVRPQDLAALRFEFHNMTLSGSGASRNVAPDGSGTAYLVAEFQPQHITEQALFEASKPSTDGLSLQSEVDASGITENNSIKNDAGNSGSDPLIVPPVAALMSGPSRLVFVVPAGRTIRLTLESLLEACGELNMSLAGNALPPEPRMFVYDSSISEMLANADAVIATDALAISGVSAWSALKINTSHIETVTGRKTVPTGRGKAALVSADARLAVDTVQSTAPESAARDLIRGYRNRVLTSKSSIGHIVAASNQQVALTKDILANRTFTLAPTHPQVPSALTTAIEAPYRLFMSPNRLNAWAHSAAPVASPAGITELWHTRLGVRTGNGGITEQDHYARAMRAIWSPDYAEDALAGPDPSTQPFRMSLDGSDRHNLVHLTSNYYLTEPPDQGGAKWKPRPVDVKNFMLSSLGAWIDLRGDFGPDGNKLPSGLAVLEWVHDATMARDHYVKVVYAGYLFPFGNQASLIKVTERKFAQHPSNPNAKVAYLFQRMYIVVREPLKPLTYDLRNPFKTARILTLRTPNLDKPEASDYPLPPDNGVQQALFWPRVGGNDFLFNMRLEDVEGGTHELTMPLAFVRKDQVDKYLSNTSDERLSDLLADYNSLTADLVGQQRRTRKLNGQVVAYADSTVPGDTSFETDTVTFGAEPFGPPNSRKRPGFYPIVRAATVIVPAVKQLMGDSSPVPVSYYQRFKQVGFSGGGSNGNTGEVFLEVLTDSSKGEGKLPELAGAVGHFDINFSKKGDKSGGLIQPNLRVLGLSRKKGPVSGKDTAALDTFAGGQFQAETFFGAPGNNSSPDDFPKDLLPKLFGVIDLWDIIGNTGVDGAGPPTFITETIGVVEEFLAAFDRFRSLINSGLNAASSIQSDIAGIQADFSALEVALDPSQSSFPGQLATQLSSLQGHVTSLLGALPSAGIDLGLRKDAEKILSRFQSLLANVNDFMDAISAFFSALEMIQQKKIRLEWKPPVKSFTIPGAPAPLFVASGIKNNKPASLTLAVEVMADGGGSTSSPAVDVYCALENFALDLVPVPGGSTLNLFSNILKIGFDRIVFFAGSSTKPGVDVVLADIEFKGILSFVETLKDLIPLDGFSDPPYIDVDASGIVAGFDLDIPGIGVGVFSLQNIALGAELRVPFIGESIEVEFNFNRPEKPCLLSVWVFGGGAYFGVTVTPRGLKMIRAAFEFGATASLNFGVASGSIHLMAGVYFEFVAAQNEGEENSITLTGYLRLGGSVRVLGIITLSIEMRMELSYQSPGGKVIGRATIQVEVEVLFFSASVNISYEKKFAGANGDPTFLQVMGVPYLEPVQNTTVDPWDMYARAFA